MRKRVGLFQLCTLSLENVKGTDDSPHLGVYSADVRDWMKDVKMCRERGLPIPNPPKGNKHGGSDDSTDATDDGSEKRQKV